MTAEAALARGPESRILTRLWRAPYLLLSCAAFLWASNFVVGRLMSSGLPPVSLGFWRWALAAPLVLPLAWPHLKRDWPALRKGWPLLLVLATTGLAGSNLLAYVGLTTVPATTALLVQSALPVAILLFGLIVFRERPTGRQIGATVLSIFGVGAIVGLAGVGAATPWLGLACVVGAMISQSLYATLLRLRPRVHATSFLFVTVALAALVTAPLQLVWGAPLPLEHPQALAGVVFVAVGPSIAAFFLFNRGVELIGAARASIFFYLMPVFGSLLAVPFLGERLGLGPMVGFALIGAGFLLVLTGRQPQRTQKT
ncbi:DMT family transporter [Brevundimonas sp. SL130]|uniref:DMT family transporter n=1 Tax=Brevundimonas sp. SL130 TaxID=2995143 RepID=UPI00226C82D9|nr:DMT family transporter [Brevundimonas sp. SL130]WAC58818.1 DMT family transporter [Brevundimonas sp. SL130]